MKFYSITAKGSRNINNPKLQGTLEAKILKHLDKNLTANKSTLASSIGVNENELSESLENLQRYDLIISK